MEAPGVVYSRRLEETAAQLAMQRRRDLALAYSKVIVFLGGAGAAILLLHSPGKLGLLAIPAVVFVALLVAHERVIRRGRRLTRVKEFYERGIARLEDRWAGTGESGERFLEASHPYARDLDLFGAGSLFELVCAARTRAGESRLARWLLERAGPSEVRARQQAVMEMQSRLAFRERLFMAGDNARVGLDPEAMTAWAEGPQTAWPWGTRALLTVLAVIWLATLVFWWTSGGDWDPLLWMSVVNYAVNRLMTRRVDERAAAVEAVAKDLLALADVLAVMEQEEFQAERLRALRARLKDAGIVAAKEIRRLGRIVQWLEARQNIIARPFYVVLFCTAQLTMTAEGWRRKYGASVRVWLECAGEFEALGSLAGYAAEHAGHVLPEFVEDRPWFEAEDLMHPLLPAGKAVGNDVRLNGETQLMVISGPNMAGKSTFLRGVGLNAVLAQCGAPVRAKRLRLSPVAVGASICVLDSLQGGVSRFYAEIQRLKLLADLARGDAPLLFLLDELLSGTNSHDRYEGTRYVVQALVRRGAIGMVTTHDLALTEIPALMEGKARNYHFEDRIEGGELQFDYRLKPGVVQTSNALKLMQQVGLEVG